MAWAQENDKGGKRLNMQVLAVQYLADGESFGGGGAEADLDAFAGVPAPDGAMGFDAPAAPAAAAPPAFGFGTTPASTPAVAPTLGQPATPAGSPFGMPTF
jgi:hypothetical protein